MASNTDILRTGFHQARDCGTIVQNGNVAVKEERVHFNLVMLYYDISRVTVQLFLCVQFNPPYSKLKFVQVGRKNKLILKIWK